MTEIDFNLLIQKEDLKLVFSAFKKHEIEFPVYFIDLGNYLKIEFISDYEEYELIKEIENLFPEYEFTSDFNPGELEIKITLNRTQSPLSTDGWGRRIENPLDEKLYLVKKVSDKNSNEKINFNPEVIVFHNSEISSYFINLIKGEKGKEKGFLVLKDFENNLYGKKNETDFFEKLNRGLLGSFFYGISELKDYLIEKSKNKNRRKRGSK